MLTCAATNGTFSCTSNDESERAAIKSLQQLIRDATGKMAGRPDLATLQVNGHVGAATALGAQHLLATLNRWAPLPAELQPILMPQATFQEIIQRVAEQTNAIGRYVTSVLAIVPHALTSLPPTPPAPAPPPSQQAIGETSTTMIKATAKKVLGIGIGLAALGGGAVVAKKYVAKRRGLVDQAHLLPGGDEDDGDDD